MLDIVALVVGVPLVLMTLLLALGRFEASVTPDVEEPGGQPVATGAPEPVLAGPHDESVTLPRHGVARAATAQGTPRAA